MSVIIATPGAADANSYATLLEAAAYFTDRLPLVPSWSAVADQTAALIMATRVLDLMSVARRTLRISKDGTKYFYTSRAWTGAPATTTQALAWPRIGMYDLNGNLIASTVIPQMLKNAECELAGQLNAADTTLDNPIIVGGITSVKAGSVAVTFKEDIAAQVLPMTVMNLMPPSWFTDQIITSAISALFDVIGL